MLDLDKIKPDVIRLCQRLKVTRLDLFGSAATEVFRPESDVDVLVEFDQNLGDMFNRYFELKEGLEKITGRSVDVIMEDAIKIHILKLLSNKQGNHYMLLETKKYLHDILSSAQDIEGYVGKMDLNAFRN
jgi:uncharacterized protein